MILHDAYIEETPVNTVSAIFFRKDETSGSHSEEKEMPLLTEHRLDIVVNDVPTYRLNCTSEYLAELVLGRLCSDRIIRTKQDMAYLSLCRYGKTATVYLSEQIEGAESFQNKKAGEMQHYPEETPTCCTDNLVLNRNFVREDLIPDIPSLDWKPEWIYACASTFQKDTPLHKKTSSTHSCFLCRNGEILFSVEDIGRHNAMDKAIGYALLNDVPLAECYLYTSGRVPTDMMRKVLYAGVPLLISKELPTMDAAELASLHGITLIGKARPDSYLLF